MNSPDSTGPSVPPRPATPPMMPMAGLCSLLVQFVLLQGAGEGDRQRGGVACLAGTLGTGRCLRAVDLGCYLALGSSMSAYRSLSRRSLLQAVWRWRAWLPGLRGVRQADVTGAVLGTVGS